MNNANILQSTKNGSNVKITGKEEHYLVSLRVTCNPGTGVFSQNHRTRIRSFALRHHNAEHYGIKVPERLFL